MGKVIRYNTETFIEKAKEVHGDKYDYSLTKYTGRREKVKIICSIHGIFEQNATSHRKGFGCAKCGGVHISNTLEFIEKANKIHNNEYNYSLVNYITAHIKVKIICKDHGIFLQKPNNHLIGSGCPKCKIMTTDVFIKKAKVVHGDKFDYSLSQCKSNKDKIKIICKKHGIFEQILSNHLLGNGCPRCVGRYKTTEEFINQAKKIHGEIYDYSSTEYINSYIKIKVICRKHGIFTTSTSNHLKGCGCPNCKSSRGENKISLYLDDLKIKYFKQKRFKSCRYKYPLPFDFYLPNYNLCIEYDGLQHKKPVKYWGGEEHLKYIQMLDKIKNDFCKENNITLIRINSNENNLDKLSFLKHI